MNKVYEVKKDIESLGRMFYTMEEAKAYFHDSIRDRFNKNNELLEKMRFNFENSFSMLKSKKYKKKINEI